YRASSGDPESDEIVREEIQRSFRQHGIILADHPDDDALRDIMLDAYKKSTQELGGDDLSSDWENKLTRDFDTFTASHSDFYTTTYDSYETRYEGEPVDLAADYDRMVQENDGVDPHFIEPTEADIDAMERDRLKQFSRAGEMKPAGLSYTGHAPGAKPVARRSYQQIKQEEMAAQEVKGYDYDKKYDSYARGRGDSYQKTTAGDDYGFDEPEDDGPEL
ncbi:MAG TPA: hypothetical protein VFK27_00715, partial [Bacillales bacterium]|nr:hypothetical protein [Bacillales bacterium]